MCSKFAAWSYAAAMLICAAAWRDTQIIGNRLNLNPFDKGTLFLFCGKRTDRIKALLWMGNGFILMNRRFEDGHLSWPRTPEQAADLTEEQYHLLMRGYDPVTVRVRDVNPDKVG